MAKVYQNLPGRLRGRAPRRGFNLIELLLVIAIIATLAALLMPGLARARERGRMTACLSNMRQIASAMVMYMQENSDELPWVNGNSDPQYASPFTWGGFRSPQPELSYFRNADFTIEPAEQRPFNRFLAPGARGNDVIKVYICPSDSSLGVSETPVGSIPNDIVTSRRSWETAGNSFAINWWWMNYYFPQGDWTLDEMGPYAQQLVRARSGGRGSTFTVFYEAPLNSSLVDARASGGGLQVRGWHGAWSQHSLLFLDAHAEHRYVDSRYPFGDGWTAWPAPN